MPIRLFISHSPDDVDVVNALMHLLEQAFHIEEEDIRCTSVPGYKLPTGTTTSTTLKQDIKGAELVLCILTPVSQKSEWVLFELGAAWAMDKWIVPVLVGLDFPDLPEPIKGLHVIKGTDNGGIHQLLDEIAQKLKWERRPSAKADAAVRGLVHAVENPIKVKMHP